jgi:hypothetical protein
MLATGGASSVVASHNTWLCWALFLKKLMAQTQLTHWYLKIVLTLGRFFFPCFFLSAMVHM